MGGGGETEDGTIYIYICISQNILAPILLLPPLSLMSTSDAPKLLLLKPWTPFSQTVQSILLHGSENRERWKLLT